MAKNTPGVSVYLDSGSKTSVLNSLKRIELVDSQIGIALLAGAQPLVNKAKTLAPYKTGTLRRSIHAEATSMSGDSVVVGTDVVYAKFQELGTSRMQGHPFLRPAMAQSANAVQQRVSQAIRTMMGGK